MTHFRIPFFIPWVFPRRIWKMDSKTSVFLTFDDGPQPEITDWILQFLEKEQIAATFFCVGNNVSKNPSIFEKVKNAGHTIGNHTMHHEKGTSIQSSAYFHSVHEADQLINSVLFRPPYGRLSLWKGNQISKKYHVIMWSWLSYDYDSTVPMEQILKSAEKIQAGDILVFHDNPKSSERLKALLPEVVKIIRSKNLLFEPIIL